MCGLFCVWRAGEKPWQRLASTDAGACSGRQKAACSLAAENSNRRLKATEQQRQDVVTVRARSEAIAALGPVDTIVMPRR